MEQGTMLDKIALLNQEKLNTILAELRHQLEDFYGSRLVRLILYGSQARGDAEPGSDIDILVVLKGPVNPGEQIGQTNEIIASLSLQHDIVISCVFVSAERLEHEQSALLINVRREGVTFWPTIPNLIKAENNRKVGDYDIGSGLTKAQALTQLERAEQFLDLGERLIGQVSASGEDKN